MARTKLTKVEKNRILRETKKFKEKLIAKYFFKSDDENIINLANEARVLVKLIMAEEIAKQVQEYIKNKEIEILKDKERRHEQKQQSQQKHNSDKSWVCIINELKEFRKTNI